MNPISPVLPSNPQVPEIVVGKNQPEYLPLPAVVVSSIGPTAVVTRWELSQEERQAVAEGASVWLETWTFGDRYQPIRPSVTEPFSEMKLQAPCPHEQRYFDPEPWPTGEALEICAQCGMSRTIWEQGDSGWVMVDNLEAARAQVQATLDMISKSVDAQRRTEEERPAQIAVGKFLYSVPNIMCSGVHEGVAEADTIAFDSKGRICRTTAHYLQASEEDAFPVRVYLVR